MIELFLRKLTVRRRIVGGFLIMVILMTMAIPMMIGNHNYVTGRLKHVTTVETRTDRLLLLASTRVMSSRLNLLRYFQDYLPSAWVAIEDTRQATDLLKEAQSLIHIQAQQKSVSFVIEQLHRYIALIKNVQRDAVKGKQPEAARKVFLTLKTGNDITQMIEQIVRESETSVAMINQGVNQETRKRVFLVVAGFGFVLVLSLIFSFLVSHSITRPLTQLRKGTDEFRRGDMDFRIPVLGKDELSLLALTFNNMADQLQLSLGELRKHRDHLEELVKERMEEISEANDQLKLEIAERRKVEYALKESEKKYRTLYSSMNEGVCLHEIIYDASGIAMDYKILDVNPAYETITGLSRDVAVGSNASQLYGKGDAPFLSVYSKVVETGKPESFETYWAPNEIYLRVSAFSPGKDQFALVFSDITEKHHLESRLRQAQKMESIGTLAGGIAHDFNNILGIILGNTELALDDSKEWNMGKRYLEEILSAATRAKDVVRQILSFARKSLSERRTIKIGPIIDESLKLLRASIPSTIEIQSSIIHVNDTVLADPTQINQVLMNLCTNSTHAMKDNGGVLNIDLDYLKIDKEKATRIEGLSPGEYVTLSVTDTGHGIPPQIMDRIFDPYYTTKEIGDGTGMGLAVVHGIIKNHDGTIHIQSEPGKGTDIKIFFPFVDVEAMDEIEIRQDLPRGTERILYVDDEVSLVQIVKQMLERLGYEVVTRTNSVEALELFKARPNYFDLVITDMTMPYMTGDELAKQLISYQDDIPIILCTGYSDIVDEDKARSLGIKSFILKPIVMSKLAIKLREVLG